MKNKSLMKILSAFFAVAIVLCSAPLSGFFGIKAEATQSSGSINIGDLITLGSYNGKRIRWRCVDIDENGPLMLAEDVLCNKEYDAPGKDSTYHTDGWSNSIRSQRGSNCWFDSNIRQWLNSSERNVSWSHCPPSYSSESGFLTNFTNTELNYIKSVKRTVNVNIYESKREGYCSGGNSDLAYKAMKNTTFDPTDYYFKNIWDKVFLLDATQYNSIYNKNREYLKASSEYFTCVSMGNNYACYELVISVSANGVSGGQPWASGKIGIRPAFYLNVDAGAIKRTIKGTFESYVYSVILDDDKNQGGASEVTIDGVSYAVGSGLSISMEKADNYKNKEVVAVVNNNTITWMESIEDIKSGLNCSISLSDHVLTYQDENYSKNTLTATVWVSSTNLTAGFNGDISIFNEIPELKTSLSSLELTTSNSDILNFDGKEKITLDCSDKLLDFGKSVPASTVEINVKKSHKISDDTEKENVVIKCIAKGIKNNKEVSDDVWNSVEIRNSNYSKPTINNQSPSISDTNTLLSKKQKAAAILSEITDYRKKSAVVIGDDINGTLKKIFSEEELRAIGAEFLTEAVLVCVPEDKLDYPSKVFENLMGFKSNWFRIIYQKEISIVKVVKTNDYGTLKVEFTCDLSNLTVNSTKVGFNGTIKYKILNDKIPSGLVESGLVGGLAGADVTKFADSVYDVANEIIKSSYEFGDTASDAAELIFGQTVDEILRQTKYGSYLSTTRNIINAGKKFTIYCPVDVFVYDSNDVLVAAVENNEVILSTEKAQISVEGDTKILWLYDNDYRVEYNSLASYNMKVVVEEYGSSDNLLRTAVINDIPLESGVVFEQKIDQKILEDAEYSLVSSDNYKTYDVDSYVNNLHEHKASGKMEIIKDSTCDEYGFKTAVCTVCNEWFNEIISEKPHTCGEWYEVELGLQERRCSVCDGVEQRSLDYCDASNLKIIRGIASNKLLNDEYYLAITVSEGKTMTGLYKDMVDGGTVELVDICGNIQDRENDYVAYQSQNKTNPVATMKVTYADGTTETYPVVFELYEMEREIDFDISKNIRPIRGKASLAEDAKGEYILVEMLEGQSSVGVYKTTTDGKTTATLLGAEGMFTEQETLYIFYGSQNTFNPEGRLTVTEADGTQKTYRIVFKMYEMNPYVNAAKGLRPIRGAVTFDADGTIRIKMTSGQKSVGLYKTMANGATFKIVDANGRLTNNSSSVMFYMTNNKANVTATMIFTLPDGTTKEQKIIFDMGLASDPDPLETMTALRGTVSYQNDGTEDYIEVKANAGSTGVGLYKDCLVKYTITDVEGEMTENDSRYFAYAVKNPDGLTANINFLQSDGSYKTYKVKFVF